MESFDKNIHLMLEFLIALTLFLLCINDFSDDVTCDIADVTTLLWYDQASDLWQQLELTSELEYWSTRH